ncbi:MAG: putative membrane protein YphA (DoxX/SURF4 family) [Verrucomicrobiales bacterium]|jgi:uncharacterized membrane protein YphA (DoxX/SURF4 family)
MGNFGLPLVHFCMLILRFFSGLALITYQGWRQVQEGWAYLWHNGSWGLVDHFNTDGKSTAIAVFYSVLVAVFYFFSPFLLMIGFLTRLSALIILVGLMVTLNLGLDKDGLISTSLHSQTMALYLLIGVFFVLNGGGVLAIDRLFDRRRGKKRQAGGLYA